MADTSLRSYRAKRDFTRTQEPEPADHVATGTAPMFVVQKHAAHRAGLHWDFRLEHDGVLWSWAVPKGPSLDPADRRMAIHVEDHPIDYASFQGSIPDGSYGAGTVETWDRGTWEPLGDPAEGMRDGHLRFTLNGERLHGRFTLARLSRRDPKKPDGWFLIKGRDAYARDGIGAPELEAAPTKRARGHRDAPAQGARRGALPATQAPQLCTLVETPPDGDEWLSEIKFDGYRILARKDGSAVQLLTRSGLDWTDRMPALAEAVGALAAGTALLDGELVALAADGTTSFPLLQDALKSGRIDRLAYYAFDLLHLDGWDLRPAGLRARKVLLRGLIPPHGMLRYSDHVEGDAAAMHGKACSMRLEGVVCKRADDPYRLGRGPGWLKVKCQGREEFVVLGWTPPGGSRTGFGALHVGFHDAEGRMHYAGAVGSGYDTDDLARLRRRLDTLSASPPELLLAGEPIDRAIRWVRPELVVEVQYTGWSGSGRVRHAVFLGERDDKPPADVVRDLPDPDAPRMQYETGRKRPFHIAVPPRPKEHKMPSAGVKIVTAKKPGQPKEKVGGVEISHPGRELWPGITKLDLARYWSAVSPHALPGLVRRPLSILRCPEGVGGESFFQKNGHGHLPAPIREGRVGSQPYLAIDGDDGLFALAQMSAIELHPWGAAEADPTRPDRLVFDLDPGEGVAFATTVAAAHEVRDRLRRLGLESLCRTTGGKGLHVVVPLTPHATWERVKPFCRAFAETMAADAPDRYVAHIKIADRKGKILVDWLRNGLGATAVASFCPRARPGAGVAMPLAWRELTPKLDPAAYTVLTVPKLLARRKDPWADAAGWDQRLPDLTAPPATRPAGAARIVTARKPRKH